MTRATSTFTISGTDELREAFCTVTTRILKLDPEKGGNLCSYNSPDIQRIHGMKIKQIQQESANTPKQPILDLNEEYLQILLLVYTLNRLLIVCLFL